MTEIEQKTLNAAAQALITASAAMDLQTQQIERLKTENAELKACIEMLEAMLKAKA